MLYSYNGRYPKELPNRIRLSDGSTRTDRTTFTAEEIVDAGYVEVQDKPTCEVYEYIVWQDGQWNIIDDTENYNRQLEYKEANKVRTERDYLISQADILINKAEDNEQDASALRQYRQALRDVPQQEGFPFDVVFPENPNTIEEA
jgi:hypothetical protein